MINLSYAEHPTNDNINSILSIIGIDGIIFIIIMTDIN